MTMLRLSAAALILIVGPARADGPPPRKAVADLPEIKGLPDALAFLDGSPVKTPGDWARRRSEIKALFEDYEYGHFPPRPEKMAVERGETRSDEGAGADRQDLTLNLEQGGKALALHVALTLPKGAAHVPVVIQSTFSFGLPNPAAAKKKAAPRPDRLKLFTDRGYGVAELSFQELAPDNKDRARTAGIYPFLGEDIDTGALMAWAWGVSRVIDAIESDPRIDPGKIVVTGHSRYGKAALVAGAFEDRIALTVPSHSGCGGASPYRFIFGKSEQLADVVRAFPYWFRPDFKQFVGNVDRLPVDQDLLRALVAPRALLATEGTLDTWINPEGSQMTHLAALKVYEFLGVPDKVAINFRPVGHIPSNEDLLDFADHVFAGKPLPADFGKLAYPVGAGAGAGKIPGR